MNWELFYQVCFFVGLSFSVIGVLGGMMHFHLPIKMPHVHIGHWHLGGAGHGVNINKPASAELPFFNIATLMIFVCWFGAMGYLLTAHHVVAALFVLFASLFAGFTGSWLVYRFMRLLSAHESHLDPADFEMVGVVGTAVIPVREGGTGEMVYLQQGTRRVCGIRSENGSAIAKGTEVVVTRHEKGLAYVRVWEEFADEHGMDVREQ
jgi:membrane protein implicated in regulation of membrane protease activity